MPRVPIVAIRIGPAPPQVLAVSERESTRTIFLGARLLTGAYWNQLAMYWLSTRVRAWIRRRLARTRLKFFARSQKAFRDVCSHRRQHITTTQSRVVMESQLRPYRSAEMFLMRIRKRFFTECMLISGGRARRLPGSTLRT